MEASRVLHVFGKLNRGGAESRTMDIYRQLDRDKVQFDFMVHGSDIGGFEAEISRLGGHVYHAVPVYRVINALAYYRAWRRFFGEQPYDCVHIHTTNSAAPILRAAARAGVHTRICHAHSTNVDRPIKAFLLKINRPAINRMATHRFAVSDEAGRFVFGKGGFRTIPNAIQTAQYRFDPRERQSMRAGLGINDAQFVLGHVGRLEPMKNHMFMLDVAADLHKENAGIRLVFVGEGKLRAAIEERIERLGIASQVTLLGMRDDVPALLQAFDLFLLPSLFEGLPGAAIEAQAAGLPVLLSNAITREAMLADWLVSYLPLEKTAWTEAIRSRMQQKSDRQDTSEVLKNKDFDSVKTAKWYQDFYLEQQGRS